MTDTTNNSDAEAASARKLSAVSSLSSLSATSPANASTTSSPLPSYPMPVRLRFTPGGVSYAKSNNNDDKTEASSDTYLLSKFSEESERAPYGSNTPRSERRRVHEPFLSEIDEHVKLFLKERDAGKQTPDWLVHKAKLADDRLNSYIRLYVGAGASASASSSASSSASASAGVSSSGTPDGSGSKQEAPVFLPSLSVLANAAFGRLTGAPPSRAKTWADAMVMQYHDTHKQDEDELTWPRTEEEVAQEKPTAIKHVTRGGNTTVALLKRLLEEEEAAENKGCDRRPRRPCGYVFKTGDIAWNCRTCQTDSTCVICDACFRESDHEGHEVYFHRTTPGGCCDCGDAEAWKVEGCCPAHRPLTPVSSSGDDSQGVDGEADPEEAVRMAQRGLKDGLETLKQSPTKLPPKLAAALGVVIGAAVRCLVEAVDGAGIGADPVQWKLRWADEACRIWNGAAEADDYHNFSSPSPQHKAFKTPGDFLFSKISECFPGNYNLQLRLMNDDVHTFDEVIAALRNGSHSRRHDARGSDPQQEPLVRSRDEATKMTHHVDADGQVTVKTFATIQAAMDGYRKIKSKGLFSSVVSSAQCDMELRARHLSSWLSEISAAHPSAAVLVVHALLQIKSSQDLGGIAVWQEARSIPSWVAPNETDEVEACLKRFRVFPPHLATSYVTGEEAEKLHRMAMAVDANAFFEMTASSFRAPISPAILLLLMDPYPTKQLRGAIHSLFLSLLTDARFKCRFAAALGIAYRPLSSLFCAGVGTEADTPLGFTVQIFTAGSLVRALGSSPAAAKLLLSDDERDSKHQESSIAWARLLRLAQGMDPQKRKISGGHVEYEQQRWLEAFGLSLNFAGTRDALAESPTNSSSAALAPVSEDGSHLVSIREAMGNIMTALLKEMKLWLYREGMLEIPLSHGANHTSYLSQVEALQRSTLHLAASQLGPSSAETSANTIALSCATSVNMTEPQLTLIENSLNLEGANRRIRNDGMSSSALPSSPTSGAVMGDWLRVPHSPLAGDSLSFHLPLHRALAKTIKSLCAVVVPESVRNSDALGWWKLPVIDSVSDALDSDGNTLQHPLVPLIRPTLRKKNCKVVWSAVECNAQEAQRRRQRSRTVAANIAVAKIIHSLVDHPIRCLAAAQQIERHLWARNGSSVAGMALNYSNAPLCRSFRDLDLALVQLSASGMSAGLGARRVLSLLTNRFSMDGYLCDPERRAVGNGSYKTGLGIWINPPRLNDPEHAPILSESFFSTLCILVTELPPPPPISPSDETWLRQSIRRELIHALAAEPRSYSAAMAAASCAVGRRDESDGSAGTSGGGGLFRDVFAQVLKEVGKQKAQGSRAKSGPSSFELSPTCCDEYDPTFFHLRRQEHQHAMDVVYRLRKQKLNKDKEKKSALSDPYCFPLVCQPPKAHPRFIACRLMLHLQPMDAAIRRALLFALCGGSWLPPPEPVKEIEVDEDDAMHPSNTVYSPIGKLIDDANTVAYRNSRHFGTSPSRAFQKRASFNEADTDSPFSAEVVAASSVSFLEELQLLTLQVHTLEECASLHRLQPDLDEEAKSLSAGLSINSYLGRLVHVPKSLDDVWALRPFPDGPLKSKGSGERRGSILGLLIALYEYRGDHGTGANGSQEEIADGHGGARALTGSGLKWLLRFVNALIDGAPSVGTAVKSATSGIPLKPSNVGPESSGSSIWTIDEDVRVTIRSMLTDLPDLWPKAVDKSLQKEASVNEEKKERGKLAQQRMLEMMRKKQSAFSATMGTPKEGESAKVQLEQAEDDLCIICRCDDADGENNGPLGYLGHVQRSRVAQMRACSEGICKANEGLDNHSLYQSYRVVGHMGCQVRETEAMDSRPVNCLKRGTIVSVLKNTVSDKYDIMSRRVLLKHTCEETGKVSKGWASMQSSQGYVILSPVASLCYENTRWGSTRPIVRLCGHAAHLKCVEAHTLSLHQRSIGDQPFDGRFAANIHDGEYLCPLCKQLSNILVPKDGCAIARGTDDEEKDEPKANSIRSKPNTLEGKVHDVLTRGTFLGKREADSYSPMGKQALTDFGGHLMLAMVVPWERTGSRKKKARRWHPSIQRWDYEDDDDDDSMDEPTTVGGVLRLLRQQHIAWAAIGHSAATAEAAVRGIEEVLPFGTFSKTDEPWPGYKADKGNDPMLLELTRTMTGTAGLFEVLMYEMASELGADNTRFDGTGPSIVAKCLSDILCGYSWMQDMKRAQGGLIDDKERNRLAVWSEATTLMSAMPCHVARDGMLSQRHEARAVAAAMWVSGGLGSQPTPPTPLCINEALKRVSPRSTAMGPNWGSLEPTARDESPSSIPFRPAVATAFLYTPLLAWDLNVLAGAVFSSILVNTNDDVLRSEEILECGRLLITGRMIQALITPGGFDSVDGMEIDEEDEEGRWDPSEILSEGQALAKLHSHCKARVSSGSLDNEVKMKAGTSISSPSNLFGNVGRAILPFARSIILLMRACNAATKSRNRRKGMFVEDPNSAALELILDGTETMSSNDGMFLLKEMGGPMPSVIVDESNAYWGITNRWLTAVIGLERHHGSSGKSLLPDLYSTSGSTQEDTSMRIDSHEDSRTNGEENKVTTENYQEMDSVTDQEASIPAERNSPIPSLHLENSNESNEDVAENGMDAVANFYDEEDEVLVEEMDIDEDDDEEEEMIDYVDHTGAGAASASINTEDSGDEPSSSGSDDGENQDASHLFVAVGESPIISYQPSLLGQASIGPGQRGSMLEAGAASSLMSDLSHLGLVHCKDAPTFSLIRLPKSFVELYGIVSKVKGREESASLEEAEEIGNAETAICLLTGTVMRSGCQRRSLTRRDYRPPGACTIHARKNGSGIGIFFLIQKCTVLLMHNNKSAYSASLYVDEHGEEDPGLRRGRPLFLNDARFRALEQLWRHQGIPREVAQIRSTSDRVIRDNWY
eukprot:jgi/Psemu1/291151/fgenesh1_pg.632_\